MELSEEAAGGLFVDIGLVEAIDKAGGDESGDPTEEPFAVLRSAPRHGPADGGAAEEEDEGNGQLVAGHSDSE